MDLHPTETKSQSNKLDAFLAYGGRLKQQTQRFIAMVYTLLRKEVWLVEPIDDDRRKDHAVLFVGNPPEKHYVGKLFFKNDFACRSLGFFWLWQILFTNKALRHISSFCIIQTRWPLFRSTLFKKWHCLPAWVYGSVNLKTDFSKFAQKSRSAKNTLRKIQKRGFSVEISSDPAMFDEFYHRFHQPYMKNRHGESSVEVSYNRMKAKFLNGGELLFVSDGSLRVAGSMLQYNNGEVTAYRLGVRDGDFRWVEKGAISALYFHLLSYCRFQGFPKLHLGGSRPFLSDGVLNYKLKNWNMTIDDYAKDFYFLMKLQKKSPSTAEFLCSNPFVSFKGSKMVANVYFSGTDHLPDRGAADRLRTKYAGYGLGNVDLHCCGNQTTHRVIGKQVNVST
jgi:hypothetical protein